MDIYIIYLNYFKLLYTIHAITFRFAADLSGISNDISYKSINYDYHRYSPCGNGGVICRMAAEGESK